MKAIILHGTQGSPEINWFRWLEASLKKEGWEVWLPALPNAEKPSLTEWSDFVIQNAPFSFDEQTVAIGHSSGAILALIVAQKLNAPIRATFCVSAFKDNDFLKWEANDRLFDEAYDFLAIRANAGTLVFIHSNNDPYCPLDHAQYLSEKSGGELIIIPNQGHFNTEKDKSYVQFPKILEIIHEKAGM